MLRRPSTILVASLALSAGGCASSASGGDVSPDGARADSADSADSARADASDTSGHLCTPGSLFCVSAREAGVCDATGEGAETVTACAGATACEPSSGLCRATICEPERLHCLDLSRFERCRPDGSGWLAIDACPSEQFCADGRCRVCQAGRVECLDERLFRQCAPDGSGWSDDLTCPDDQRCAGHACRPCHLTEECLGPMAMRRFCANEALDFSETLPCPLGHECSAGSCQPCEPGESQCVSEGALRECGADGRLLDEDISCEGDEICLGGICIDYWCAPRVLLLVDRSGSMAESWDAVRDSISTLVKHNPTVRFGLMSFPTGGWVCDVAGTLQIDFAQHIEPALRQWFSNNSPSGATPLAEAIEVVLNHAGGFFGEHGGALVVLSDGEDTCFAGGEIKADLAVNTSALYLDHQVSSYAVGYNFGGDPVELDTIANNGGTGLRAHIPADDSTGLTEAFQIIVDDFKRCQQ